MEGTYYSNPVFPGLDEEKKLDDISTSNSLINNKGKEVKIFTNFKDEEINGRFEYINNEYIIVSNLKINEYTLIFIKNINYIVFNESINI